MRRLLVDLGAAVVLLGAVALAFLLATGILIAAPAGAQGLPAPFLAPGTPMQDLCVAAASDDDLRACVQRLFVLQELQEGRIDDLELAVHLLIDAVESLLNPD